MSVTTIDFLMGQGDESIVFILNDRLPSDAPHFTVAATPKSINFKAGWDSIAQILYNNPEVFSRLTKATQIGVVSYKPPNDPFPDSITELAYVQTRSDEL